jgi:flagellar biosynthetic protein FliR
MSLEVSIAELVGHLSAYLWPFVRIGAFVIAMPVIGGSFVPQQVRLLFAMALTLIITPILPVQTDVEFLSIAGLVLTIQEIIVGVAMGFAVQLVFDAIALGGQVIAMSMGLGFAVFLDRERGVNVPVLGQLFLMLGMLVFLALDGHLALIQLLSDSFQILPIATGGLSQMAISNLLAWSSQVFVVAMKIALPAVTSLLVVNLSFGVTSRAAPTLNLFAVGFPVAMLLGFVVIFLSLGSLTENVSRSLEDVLGLLPGLLSG